MKWLRIHFLVVRPVPFGSLRFPLSPRRRRERVARFTVLSLRSFPLRGRLRREDGERDVETRGS